MNPNILKPEIQEFLARHLKDDVNKIALTKSPFEDVSSRELAEQLDGKQRSEKKLPSWFNTKGIIFPPKLCIEQSSSEQAAKYKSRLVKGRKLIDLTGGSGVDAFFFSLTSEEVIHIEQNAGLSRIAQHNLQLLGARNIRFIITDSIEYLKGTTEKFDTIYIDPSRRIQSKKVFLLKDTEPDIISDFPLLLSKASRIIVKTSPLYDIQSGLKELSHVSEVHVVSIKNDCKELLWVVDKEFTAEPEIIVTALDKSDQYSFRFRISEEKDIKLNYYSEPLDYLYEPDAALLKAGAFKSITRTFSIDKLQQNTHLYTSAGLVPHFTGKTFKIRMVLDYKTFIKENQVKKANVISRNFPLSPEELKKKHKLHDGGSDFLIFTTAFPDKLLVIYADLVL